MGNRFQRGSSIIDNKDVLRDDWQPEELVEREEELDEYAAALQPVIEGWQPSNVFVYGVTGTGKTAGTRELLTELLDAAADEEDILLNVVEVNCNSLNSSYQVAVSLVNEFRNPSHRLTSAELEKPSLSETGHPQQRVFNELYDDIEDAGGTVLFVLDEIDNIGTDDDILYELPRARSTHDLDAKIGVVGISNDFKFRDALSPKVKDTLCEEEILFAPYDANALQAILERRSKQAFVSNSVLEDDVIPLCSALAAQDSGSARQALLLLRKAADIAEQVVRKGDREKAKVTVEDVRESERILQRQQVMEGMFTLTRHGQYVLLAVCDLAAELKTPERTKIVHERYERIADSFDTDPLKRRRVHDHLGDLSLHGILERIEHTRGRGNFNHYDLDVPLDSALEALEREFGEGVVERVRDKAEKNDALNEP